jgi:hypothetical protein
MPLTYQKITLSDPNGNGATSNWIDISTATRVRIVIPKLPIPQGEIAYLDYIASISHGTFDPAQNTAVIEYDEQYMCGWGRDENGVWKFFFQSAIFDRTGAELGVNRIKIS